MARTATSDNRMTTDTTTNAKATVAKPSAVTPIVAASTAAATANQHKPYSTSQKLQLMELHCYTAAIHLCVYTGDSVTSLPTQFCACLFCVSKSWLSLLEQHASTTITIIEKLQQLHQQTARPMQKLQQLQQLQQLQIGAESIDPTAADNQQCTAAATTTPIQSRVADDWRAVS